MFSSEHVILMDLELHLLRGFIGGISCFENICLNSLTISERNTQTKVFAFAIWMRNIVRDQRTLTLHSFLNFKCKTKSLWRYIRTIIQILTTFDNNGSLKIYLYFYFERKTTNTENHILYPKLWPSILGSLFCFKCFCL